MKEKFDRSKPRDKDALLKLSHKEPLTLNDYKMIKLTLKRFMETEKRIESGEIKKFEVSIERPKVVFSERDIIQKEEEANNIIPFPKRK